MNDLDAIVIAAERLRDAALATHPVPRQLRSVAEWLELAAEVHRGEITCHWCASGCCPAVDAARALLGDLRPGLARLKRLRS